MITRIMNQKSTRTLPVACALLATALVMAGCVVTSIYPYYTAKDLAFDPALVGRWVDATATNPPSASFKIEAMGEKGYWVTAFAPDATNSIEAHLFRLKKQLFLDTFPTNHSLDYVPVHQVSKVHWVGPMLETANLNYDWLTHLLEKHPGAIRHMLLPEKPGEEGGRIILTADTKELQRFILKYVNDTNAWEPPSRMKRLD
jgi:hypothetical protein